jgi:MFS family permease
MPLAVFADFWSIPYFTKIHNFTNNQAVELTAILYLSWALGAPILGWISDAFKVRKMPLVISGLATTVLFLWLLVLENVSFLGLAILLGLLGIASSGQVICFITCAELNPPRANASSIAFVNMIIMWFCGFIQSGSGWIIDRFTPIYSEKIAYQISLMIIAFLLLITTLLFWISFPKKKKA